MTTPAPADSLTQVASNEEVAAAQPHWHLALSLLNVLAAVFWRLLRWSLASLWLALGEAGRVCVAVVKAGPRGDSSQKGQGSKEAQLEGVPGCDKAALHAAAESVGARELRRLRFHGMDSDAVQLATDLELKNKELVRLALEACEGSHVLSVLGPKSVIQEATQKLEVQGAYGDLFTLSFELRPSWELPQDDEHFDACLEREWVDLGPDEEGRSLEDDTPQRDIPRWSPSRAIAVTQERLREAIPHSGDVAIFIDQLSVSDPASERSGQAIRLDLVGPLKAESWDMACSAVLACEARQVYLSREHYSASFRFEQTSEMWQHIESQVATARSHWKGELSSLDPGIELIDTGFDGFEDLAANISAILRGVEAPGWHRLQWVPDGADAVPHMTY